MVMHLSCTRTLHSILQNGPTVNTVCMHVFMVHICYTLILLFRAYGNPARSTQLVLKARTIEAGRTLAGVYVCEVQSKMNSSISIIRTLTVHVHGKQIM